MSNALITKNVKQFRQVLLELVTHIEKYNQRQLNIFVNSFLGHTPKSLFFKDNPIKTYEESLEHINKSDRLLSDMMYITSQFNSEYDLIKELIVTLDNTDSDVFQIPSHELLTIIKTTQFFLYA